MPRDRHWPGWNYLRGLAPPVLVLVVIMGWLGWDFYRRSGWSQRADEYALREWLNESRVIRKTLPDLAREYLEYLDRVGQPDPTKTEEIAEQLKALGRPTRMYQGQLPLFPEIYRLEMRFEMPDRPPAISWDEGAPRPYRARSLDYSLLGDLDQRAVLHVDYQLHAYNKRQRDEEQRQALTLNMAMVAGVAIVLAAAWAWFFLRRERERELQQLFALQKIELAEKQVLENELRRQEAEHQQDEMKRSLLEHQLATQAAEQQTLELKSQLYASIGIMAGSYAHNIKNLLVRPNDLLSRCLENDGLSRDQHHMLAEVRQTLGTVTERLQQILRTVRRDPTRPDMVRVDLNAVVRELHQTWEELARDKWKLNLTLDLCPEPLEIEGDLSHLQQAIENLLFNARDATFEMRNHLRELAHRAPDLDANAKRQALIAAAAWRGSIALRTRRESRAESREPRAVLEIQDNGIGMTDDVRRRCTETHFSTKRNNAIYEGISTGMGLGLSFVVVILENHHAQLEIESETLKGATFRVRFAEVKGAGRESAVHTG